MSASIPADVLAALDIVVLEQLEDRDFRVIGPRPCWFQAICPHLSEASPNLRPGELFAFLDNFLVDATQFWLDAGDGTLKSGLWREVSPAGKEFYLEASVLKLNDKNILLIQSSEANYQELFSLIQTARQSALDSISERKQTTEALVKATFYDPLTGLPNQTSFMVQLTQAMQRSRRDQSYQFAVLVLSLDRLQLINNSLGQLVGDQLLISVAGRLRNCLGSSDIVARLGGDEFILLMDNLSNSSHALLMANQTLSELKRPFNFSGQEIWSTGSIGIALSGSTYERPEHLVRDASTAMHHAKALGGGCYVMFEPAMYAQAVKMLKLENDLQRALREQELQPYYQPIVSLQSHQVTGFEMLVRWLHPEYGIVSPMDFVPVAEETGLILSIDQWMLREAGFHIQQWRHLTDGPLTMNVNLSVKQFEHPHLVRQVQKILNETGILPHRLMLEITENVLGNKANTAISTLHQLKETGVQLCIDDFGTGYASLSCLQNLPVDTLKIDRSFIRTLSDQTLDVVKTIISLAHNLGMKVTAEGVETLEQFHHLKALGCEEAQGHLFSHPVTSQAAVQLLSSNHILTILGAPNPLST